MNILLFLAILPVVVLCSYINTKDVNKEPMKLLLLIFFLGLLMALPVIFIETLLGFIFPIDGVKSFLILFINVFISVAFVEEFAKWIVTRHIGFNSKEFDEIFDIIVYAVFSSLGFACIENIFYVNMYGFYVAIFRAVLSVPGHMFFGVLMGYFMAKAKVSIIHKNQRLYVKNMLLSILIPSLIHCIYDSLLLYPGGYIFTIIFLIFFIVLFIVAFKMVNYVSNIQKMLSDANYKINT